MSTQRFFDKAQEAGVRCVPHDNQGVLMSFRVARIMRCKDTYAEIRHETRAMDDLLKKALENAKSNLEDCTSPGAGIEDPWEAAETAYADLIYTSSSFQNKTLSEEELMDLSKGGTMWEEGSTRQSTKGKGILKEISSLFGSLAGGAHIVRQDDGRI